MSELAASVQRLASENAELRERLAIAERGLRVIAGGIVAGAKTSVNNDVVAGYFRGVAEATLIKMEPR